MTYDDFLKLVKQMRLAQREYYKTRSAPAVLESKKWERKVDKVIKDHFEEKKTNVRRSNHSHKRR